MSKAGTGFAILNGILGDVPGAGVIATIAGFADVEYEILEHMPGCDD